MLTPEDVLQERFPTTRLRPGYDQGEVDDLLDVVVQTLRAYDDPSTGEVSFLADDVASVAFRETRLRAGYGMPEVDACLARIAETLRAHERAALGGTAAS